MSYPTPPFIRARIRHTRKNHVNDPAPQSALREWRTHMASHTRLASFAGAAAILAVMGPFNTDEVMRLVPRLAYWAVIVTVCYSIGYASNLLAEHWAKSKGVIVRIAIAAPLTSLGVLAFIYLLNGLAIGFWPTGFTLLILAVNVLVISSIITVVFYVANLEQDAASPPAPPALLDRLPFDKRAPLVAVSVEDHYVRIRTTKGEELVLMRLADAMREVGDITGLQVHRSHWVALDQVRAASRKGDGAVLSMSHGPDIAVSRSNVTKIKEAGLLPK